MIEVSHTLIYTSWIVVTLDDGRREQGLLNRNEDRI